MSTLSTYDSTVNSFYLAFYGRPADPAGLKFWSQQLAASNGELGAITQAFATSEEAQVRFGDDAVGDRIAEIYQQLFNRTIDADGLAYWTGVIEQGDASLADVSIAILNGARDSDATLSALRQQAADEFTAQVEASGTQYSGYASIEAARILVRAVTADATQTDVAQLVKAAVSFADTATKTPAVVEAIAVNTTLLALFDTARGKGDPVALAQALSDTAKAAAGDPVTLESLLRGGGMDKVLKVMPAAASLKDVVKALADGGLPAAVEVVYPTAPTTPSTPGSSAFKLKFDYVDEDKLDEIEDNVTNATSSNVVFKYTGSHLAAGQKVQASIDGDHWTQLVVHTEAASRTVTVLNVDLTGQKMHIPSLASPSISIQESAPQNVTTTIKLRVVDSNGTEVASFKHFTQDIIFDGHAATPSVKFATPESENASSLWTSFAATTGSALYEIDRVEEGAIVQYGTRLPLNNNGANMAVNDDILWSEEKPELVEGILNTFEVRQLDVAGNYSGIQTVKVFLDTVKPVGKPTVALAETSSGTAPDVDDGNNGIEGGDASTDNGSGSGSGSSGSSSAAVPVTFGTIVTMPNGPSGPIFTTPIGPITTTPIGPITNIPNVPNPNLVNLTISDLDQDTNVGWEYSTDKGSSWKFGGRNNESGSASLSLEQLTTGPVEVLVRQLDAAGNVGPRSDAYTIEALEVPQFVVSGQSGVLVISGSSKDSVLVDLSGDAYTRDGSQKVTHTQKFSSVDASNYDGKVFISGSIYEVSYALESSATRGVDGHSIVDSKGHIFTGATGSRAFADDYIKDMLDDADSLTITDTLSMEEHALLVALPDFDMATLIANVDDKAPEKPLLDIDEDSSLPNETTVGEVTVTELESGGTFQYRTSAEGQWQNGSGIVDGMGTITLTDAGFKYLDVKQFDAAGNESDIAHLEFLLLPKQDEEMGSGAESDNPPYTGSDLPPASDNDVVDVDLIGAPSGGNP